MGRSVWLRWWWAWAAPAALLAVNVVWVAGVRSEVVGRGSLIGRRVGAIEGEVTRLTTKLRQLETAKGNLDKLRTELSSLRERQLAPMRQRLVPFLIDVVARSQKAGLTPDRIGYSAALDKKTGLVHFTAAYGLKGRYEQIRDLIYELEASPQFDVIESLGLRGQDDPSSLEVGVSLVVGTYFSDVDEALMKQYGVNEVRNAGE
jgi:Tfp pilus assembly protein PilO